MSVMFRIGEEEPLFHLGEIPVRLITLLVALHSVTMVAVTLLLATGASGIVDALSYSSADVAHGQIWRLVTYAFVSGPSVWFLLEMLMLWYFGKEVENGLGWKRFGILYLGLILIGPMLLQAFGYAGRPQTASGAQEVNFAVFAAFVAMHPSARFFFGVAARWVFLGLLTISVLQFLADHQGPRLIVLIATATMAVTLIRRSGYTESLFGEGFTWTMPWSKKSPSFSVIQGGRSAGTSSRSSAPTSGGASVAPDREQEMDRILEKIARQGMASLDEAERKLLEKARLAMIRREGRDE